MSQVLPPLFIAIAAIALVLGLLALWQSVRVLFLADPGAVDFAASSDARLTLVDEKASLLKAIKELEQERDLGKISEQDYEALNARYRERAKEVLRALDSQLGDYRKQAQALVDKEIDKVVSSTPSSVQQASESKVKVEEEQPARRVCASCQTDNEADAAFCKKCGKPMADEVEEEQSEAGGAA